MSSVGLFYVGAVLFINGLMLIGLVPGKSAAILNFFVGVMQVVFPAIILCTLESFKRRESAVRVSAGSRFSRRYLLPGLSIAEKKGLPNADLRISLSSVCGIRSHPADERRV